MKQNLLNTGTDLSLLVEFEQWKTSASGTRYQSISGRLKINKCFCPPPVVYNGGFVFRSANTVRYRVFSPVPRRRKKWLGLANSVATASLTRGVVAVSYDLISKQNDLVQLLCRNQVVSKASPNRLNAWRMTLLNAFSFRKTPKHITYRVASYQWISLFSIRWTTFITHTDVTISVI